MQTIKTERMPYWIKTVVIFFLGWVVIYAGRSVLSPIMPQIQTEFGLSKSHLGLISSLFFLTYTILQVPAGLLGDRLGRKRILVSGFMLFALFIAAVSISSNFLIFIVLWMLTGASQGVYYGPQYALHPRPSQEMDHLGQCGDRQWDVVRYRAGVLPFQLYDRTLSYFVEDAVPGDGGPGIDCGAADAVFHSGKSAAKCQRRSGSGGSKERIQFPGSV